MTASVDDLDFNFPKAPNTTGQLDPKKTRTLLKRKLDFEAIDLIDGSMAYATARDVAKLYSIMERRNRQ